MNSKKKFSYSQINTFNTCQKQYQIIYLDGIRKNDESIEAFVGKRVHETLEWLYNCDNILKKFIPLDHIIEYYNKRWAKKWHKNIYITSPNIPGMYNRRKIKTTEYYYKYGSDCIRTYFRKYGNQYR